MKTMIVKMASLLTTGIVLMFAMSATASASVIYTWLCDTADCNGDAGFGSTMEISDSAFAAGDFTGVAGNVLSWDTVSGVGDGFALGLDDILSGTPGSNTDDDDQLRIVLSADRLVISLIEDISAGTNITFEDEFEGRVDFFEGANYSVGSLRDGPRDAPYSDIIIQGQFVRVIPEPSTLALLGLGLAALGLGMRKR